MLLILYSISGVNSRNGGKMVRKKMVEKWNFNGFHFDKGSNDQNKKDLDNLQNQWINLERIVRSLQHQKEDLQFEYNVLKRKHDQCPSEVEDERKDKQVFMHMCEQLQADKLALQNTINSQSDTITQMQVTIHEHEHDIDRLADKVKDLRKKLHEESKDKSLILQELKEKSELVFKLEEDREILMMENEAQGKYVFEFKEEKIKIQKENNVVKESVEMCKIILAEQFDTIIQSMEASLFTLNENLTKMKETNAHLSETVVDLESKTEQQSVTISDLESKTEQQSVTISDLESKNSDLQQKMQRQQFFLILAALILSIGCLLFLFQGKNIPSTS